MTPKGPGEGAGMVLSLVAPGEVFARIRKGGAVLLGLPNLEFDVVLPGGRVEERLVLAGSHFPVYLRAVNGLIEASVKLERRVA